MEFTTSRMEAPQTRWSCDRSLENSIQLLPHRRLAIQGGGSRPSFSMVAYVSSTLSLRTRLCKQKELFDQLTLRTFRSLAKPVEASLNELYWYTNTTKAEPQFHSWYAFSAPHKCNGHCLCRRPPASFR